MADEPLSIVVVGGSGDLARRKIYPALFALFCHGLLPAGFKVVGFARTGMDDAGFRKTIAERLTCRYVPQQSCAAKMAAFLDRCHYVQGEYDKVDSFLDLYRTLQRHEPSPHTNRLFYLAIPPTTFLDVARSLGDAGFVQCGHAEPWSRVVIEKPFGRDRRTSDELSEALLKVFAEPQIYRIDHYLGKEVIQNLLALRFANSIFEPLWSREHIRCVEIQWQEDIGVEGRGGYFDPSGIIRDVMQNHLLQILAMVAMDRPARLDAASIQDAKVSVLRQVPAVTLDDMVLGQYGRGEAGGRPTASYRDDPSTDDQSITPTFAAARLRIESARWSGVPFFVSAGKALAGRSTDIKVHFHALPGSIFCRPHGCPPANVLHIRVQPDEGIYLYVNNKRPGHGMELAQTPLNMVYKSAFSVEIPEAYEGLLLDVIRGDRSMFIRGDELGAAWDIFTPVLHRMEAERTEPELYPAGSAGPDVSRLCGRLEAGRKAVS